jgi:hypothetical protein
MKRNRLYIENRLARLRTNPEENARLIKKWERMLRRVKD